MSTAEAPGGPAARRALTDDHVAAVALSGLADMTPIRLRLLLGDFVTWDGLVRAVRSGAAGRLLVDRTTPERRAHVAATVAPWRDGLALDTARARLTTRDACVWLDGEPGYPVLDTLPEPPAVLVAEGARGDALDGPRVAIVGTRAATPHGLADAHELAATLAAAGVTIVSGVAIGIDGAAHAGALDGGGSRSASSPPGSTSSIRVGTSRCTGASASTAS